MIWIIKIHRLNIPLSKLLHYKSSLAFKPLKMSKNLMQKHRLHIRFPNKQILHQIEISLHFFL